jgi:O-antigen/teichoic acid export membrane protein
VTSSPYSKETVKRSFLHFLIGRGIAGIAGFATVILMARYMDIKSYAGFTALTGLISFAGILASLGIERVISRYLPEARLTRSTQVLGHLIWALTLVRLSASVVICIGLYLAWPVLMQWFKDVELSYFPIALVCFVIAESLFQHFSSVFQSLVQQKALTQILVIQWAGRLVMLWVALQADHRISLEEALWMMALPEMLGIVAFVVVQQSHLKQLAVQQQVENHMPLDWQGMARMAAHNYGFTLLAAPPQGYFIKMLAAIFLPTPLVAAYGFFVSLAEKARQYIPLHFFYNLIEPVLVGNYIQHKDFSKLTRFCQWLYKSNLMILIPAMVWIAVAGTHLVDMLTAGKYHTYVWVLLLVMAQLTIGSHIVLLQLILNAIERSNLLMRAGAFALVGMLVFWLLVVPINPTLLITGPILFSLICNIYIIRSLNNTGYRYGLTWQVFTGVFVAGFFALAIGLVTGQQWIDTYSSDMLITVLSGVVVLIVYLIFVFLLKLISHEEMGFLKSFLKRSV